MVCCKTGVGVDEPQTNCLDDNFSVCARIITKVPLGEMENTVNVGLVNANKHDKIKRNGFESLSQNKEENGFLFKLNVCIR